MQTMKQAAAEFLAGKRVAVTGISRNPQSHGSNVVYQRLRQRGYQVFAVNPNASEVEGDPCHHDLKSAPGGVDWVLIGTKPETAEATMHECADLGIKRVWMHRGPGAGSVSPAAADYGRQHSITVIGGGCPCMFGSPADVAVSSGPVGDPPKPEAGQAVQIEPLMATTKARGQRLFAGNIDKASSGSASVRCSR